jgi:hypothetical protein
MTNYVSRYHQKTSKPSSSECLGNHYNIFVFREEAKKLNPSSGISCSPSSLLKPLRLGSIYGNSSINFFFVLSLPEVIDYHDVDWFLIGHSQT